MPITALSTDWGTFPRIVRVTTTDNLATITATGYLNTQVAAIQAINHGAFQWTPEDSCLIYYNGGDGFFNVDYTVNFTFVPQTIEPVTSAWIDNWVFTGTDLTMSPSVGYCVIGSSPSVNLTMPTICPQGSVIIVCGFSTIWRINLNAGQTIINNLLAVASTDVLASAVNDSVTLLCVTANTAFVTINDKGTPSYL